MHFSTSIFLYIHITTIVTEETFLVQLQYRFIIIYTCFFIVLIVKFQLIQQPNIVFLVRSGTYILFNNCIMKYLYFIVSLNWILLLTAKSKTLSGRCSDSLSGSQSIRRTASLDTIYLKGQWPRDSYYMHSSLLVDKSTQVSTFCSSF